MSGAGTVEQNDVSAGYSLSEMAYSFGYNLRLKCSSFQQATVSWLLDQSSTLMDAGAPKILSLGCGDGAVDLQVLEPLRTRNRNFYFMGVDFNPVELHRFRKRLSASDEHFREAVTLRCMRFDEFSRLAQRFDLIYMVYFLQSFEHVMPAIATALRHLAPQGRLVIVHQQQSGIYDLRQRFRACLRSQKFHSSEEICALLRQQGVEFSSHTIDTFFDVTTMHAMSLDALLLMSFCFCEDLSALEKREQEAIRNAFLEHATAGADGRLRIYEPMDAIICRA